MQRSEEEFIEKLREVLEQEEADIDLDKSEILRLRELLAFYDNFGPHVNDAIKAARFFAAMEQLKIFGKAIFWLLTALGGALVALDQIKEYFLK